MEMTFNHQEYGTPKLDFARPDKDDSSSGTLDPKSDKIILTMARGKPCFISVIMTKYLSMVNKNTCVKVDAAPENFPYLDAPGIFAELLKMCTALSDMKVHPSFPKFQRPLIYFFSFLNLAQLTPSSNGISSLKYTWRCFTHLPYSCDLF